MKLEALRQRRVALLGFGAENHALAHILSAQHIPFAVCDIQPNEQLVDDWPQVHAWHVGPTYLDDLAPYDLLVRTPGISPLHPRLRQAVANGAELTSQTELFLANCPARILGVTGTKGKGTTTTLLAALLDVGQPRRVFVGGNIGTPPITFLDSLHTDDLVLLELSSFQLQGLKQSPHVALVLSITQDHLDYHASRDEYVAAKLNIARHQQAADVLITNADCPTAHAFTAHSPARRGSFSTRNSVESGAWFEGDYFYLRWLDGPAVSVCRTDALRIRGAHNRENACAAIAAAAAVGVAAESMADPLSQFNGLPHRLEYIGQRDGVDCYNDSLATTPDAAIAALNAMDGSIALIAGGANKGADFTALGQAIAQKPMRGLLLLGTEGERIAHAASAAGYTGALRHCASMEEAVEWARTWTQPGDAILLSPACASFGMFADYRDRGERFRAACGVRDMQP